MSDQTASSVNWYVVKTHAKQEDRVELNLKVHGIEVFSPRIRQKRYSPFTGEPFLVIRPFFPNYIFARFDFDSLFHKIKFTRGVHSLVTFNNTPCPVDESIIEIIRSRIDKDGFVKIGEPLSAGDAVLIKEGPLAGFSGIFERHVKESDRVIILLNTVNYQAHVQIARAAVKRIEQSAGF
jgi:transcriptional antiterminator RfaH